MIHQPLLVTGAHRTGTTWVGKMLAAGGYAYVSEPLNVLHRPGLMSAPVLHWYTYITKENEAEYLPAFQKTLALRYGLLAEIKSLKSRRDLLRMGRDLGIFLRGRITRQSALLKDPFAVFSLPWFIERLNCRVVVTVRHPAAFASSLKRLHWPFDFSDLLDQPLLMRDHLEPFRADMERMPADDIIGQSALLWRMIYRVVHATVERVPSVIVLRHEDLSRDPQTGYAQAFESLGLAYTAKVQETIRNSSSSENPVELSRRKVHSVKLDSRANLENWKKRLSPDEIARIRDLTEDVASLFYADVNWD
ncbi:MAG TPA: sulfotransferase [Anaerolineales bacterium]|nr:sulfotransferase [Anaerolineales bacterium]